MKLIRKPLVFEIKEVGASADRTLAFIANSGQVDRYGDVIEVAGWDLKNFKQNSPFLWTHNYSAPPVGTVVKALKSEQGLICHAYFPTDEEINAAGWPANIPTPETVYRMYRGGFLKAVSVGFQGLEREPILGKADEQGFKPQTGWRYKSADLYELSAVPVPADPNAVMLAVQKGIISEEQAKQFDDFQVDPPADYQEKGAIPYKEYPAADAGAAWDGPKEVAACDMAGLKTICTWMTGGKPMADMTKADFKLPHHQADGFKTVWKGVAAAMGALLGAQGGVNIPDGDRKGVYNHLAKHYAQFEKTPPEFKSYEAADLVRIALGAEPNGLGVDDLFLSGLLRSAELIPVKEVTITITKAGAVLSSKNKAALVQAQDLIGQVLAAAETQAGAEPESGQQKTEPESIYSHAFKPGQEPHGGRRAGETSIDWSKLSTIKENFRNMLSQKEKGGRNA